MIVFTQDGDVDWENSFDEEPEAEPRFACPVCGKITLPDRGNWSACSNCHWIDDVGQNEEYPDETECANKMSLNQAKKAYASGEKVL